MNDKSLTTLKWFPLQYYTELSNVDQLHLNSNRSGLYIWGFMDDGQKFWPYYVGKHRNVPFRLCEHLSNLKGGNYVIYPKDDLFKMDGKKFYEPNRLGDRVLFIQDKFGNHQVSHVQNMINRFYFTYCLMSQFKEFSDKAESTVLNCFSRNILINTRFGKGDTGIDVGNLFSVINSEWCNQNGEFDKRFKV